MKYEHFKIIANYGRESLSHSVHLPPSKTLAPSFLPSTFPLPLYWQTVQTSPPLFRESPPPTILVFRDTPLKVGIFGEPQKYQGFSSITVPEFLVKISQLGLLVMTEKNIFVYKLFSH